MFLVDVKAEAAERAEGAQGASVVFGFDGVGAVFDDFQVVFPRKGRERVHVAGPPGKMDREDGPGTGRDFAPDVRRVDIHALRFHVRQHRGGPGVDDGVGRGREGQGRRDDFVARLEFQAEQAQVQGGGAGMHGNGMLRAAVGGKGLLEARDFRACAQPAVAQAVHNFRDVGFRNEGLAKDEKIFFRAYGHGLVYSEQGGTAMKKTNRRAGRSVRLCASQAGERRRPRIICTIG